MTETPPLSDHDVLADKIAECSYEGMSARETADALLEAGVRLPARVIELEDERDEALGRLDIARARIQAAEYGAHAARETRNRVAGKLYGLRARVAELEAALAAKTAQHAETLGLLENAYKVIEEQRIAAEAADLPVILSRETAASHGFPARPAMGDKHVAPNGLYVYALFGAGEWTLRVLAADLAATADDTQEGQADA